MYNPSLRLRSPPPPPQALLQQSAPRRSRRNTRPTDETSKWKFNERFRSPNGMSLMSCNDLPVDGHASVLPLRLWRLTTVWTLLETIRLHFSPQADCERSSDSPRGESWLFLSENRFQVGRCDRPPFSFHFLRGFLLNPRGFIDKVVEMWRSWSAVGSSGAVPGPESLLNHLCSRIVTFWPQELFLFHLILIPYALFNLLP